MKDGKPVYTYNFVGIQRFNIAGSQSLPAGQAAIRYEFVSDGPGMGRGGMGTLLVNSQKVAEGRIEHTQCCVYSADEGADVGVDEGTPVTEDYKERDNKFTGRIHSVTIELKELKAAATDEGKLAFQVAVKRKMLSD